MTRSVNKKIKTIEENKTGGIIICKQDNVFISKRHNTKFRNY